MPRLRRAAPALPRLLCLLVAALVGEGLASNGALASEYDAVPRPEAGAGATAYVAHLMPWFGNSTSDPGNHWCDPSSGASYYESALGTYSSDDPTTIRKQLLLMKAAGLDGVWIDLQTPLWLPVVQAIVEVAAELELRFAVVLDNYLHADLASLIGEELRELMAEEHYYRISGRPILPMFEHVSRWGDTQLPMWTARDGSRPFVIGSFMVHSRDEQLPAGFDSLFFWHSPDLKWLEQYYESTMFEVKVGSVFRGWRESYRQQMHSPPYLGYLGATLLLARGHRPHFAQLVSWNDYGEGTMLEPSYLRAGASECGDPAGAFWHSGTETCAELFGRDVFTAQGGLPPCLAGAATKQPCSGSGGSPCADVVDCAKPLGAVVGAGPAACGGVVRSAFEDLAAVARAVAGVTEADATEAFLAILDGAEWSELSLGADQVDAGSRVSLGRLAALSLALVAGFRV